MLTHRSEVKILIRSKLVLPVFFILTLILSGTRCLPNALAPTNERTINSTSVTEVPSLVATTMPTAMPAPTFSPTINPTPTMIPTSSPTPVSAATFTATRVPTIQTLHYDVLCPTQNEQARQAYNDGNTLESQGKLEQAKASYANAIQLDGNYCDAMDNLARLFRKDGRLEDAIDLYKRSISISPDNVVAHNNLALLYQLQGNIDDAIMEYQRVVQIAPDYSEGYFGLGSAYLDKKQPNQAIPYLKKAEELYAAVNSPLVSDARYYLGVAYFMSRQFVPARDYFESSSTQMKNDAAFNYYLGLCYLSPEIGDTVLAKKYLTKAQQLGVPIPVEVQKLLDQTTVPTKTLMPIQ